MDPTSSYLNPQSGNKNNKMAIAVGVVIILAVIIGGTFLLQKTKKTEPAI